jgi:hypothetical protein
MQLPRFTSFRVHELAKIGDYPQAHQFSIYTAGGSGDAIYTQVQNYLCRMQRTDPGATAVITTYFIKHDSQCDAGDQPNFTSEVDALKAAVDPSRRLSSSRKTPSTRSAGAIPRPSAGARHC